MARRLILVRHGETAVSGGGRLCGRRDVPLSARGRAQAAELRAVLDPELADGRGPACGDGSPAAGPPAAVACFTSPLERARCTAALAIADAGSSASVMPELVEVDVGEWEGLTYSEAAARDPDEAARWASWDPAFAFPGGERMTDFQARVRRACDVLRAREEQTVIAFTHGGVIRAALCLLLGLSSRNYLIFDVGPACVATVELLGELGVLSGLRNVGREWHCAGGSG